MIFMSELLEMNGFPPHDQARDGPLPA
jgi:hypothetical protein